jgi:hypothetical protein
MMSKGAGTVYRIVVRSELNDGVSPGCPSDNGSTGQITRCLRLGTLQSADSRRATG